MSDCLFVRYLWTTLVTFNFEFTFETVDNDFEVKLTHTRDNCLTSLFVSFNSKCRVFFSEFTKTNTKFIEVSLRFRLNCDTNHWIWEVHRLEYDLVCFVAKSVTCTDIFETNTCSDITSSNFFNRVLFVRVHLEETRDTFFFARASVEYVRTSFEFT